MHSSFDDADDINYCYFGWSLTTLVEVRGHFVSVLYLMNNFWIQHGTFFKHDSLTECKWGSDILLFSSSQSAFNWRASNIARQSGSPYIESRLFLRQKQTPFLRVSKQYLNFLKMGFDENYLAKFWLALSSNGTWYIELYEALQLQTSFSVTWRTVRMRYPLWNDWNLRWYIRIFL